MVDINVVAENLTELLTNTVNMTDIFYDLFINPVPMDVTLWQYNSENELVEIQVPNRAKDRKIALTGNVAPMSSTDPLVQNAALGTCYVNVSTNDVYFRVRETGSNLWLKIATLADIESAIETLSLSIEANYVPDTRKINNKSLSSDIILDYSDVGALSDNTLYGSAVSFTNAVLYLKDQNGNTLSTADMSSTQGADVGLTNLSSTGEDKLQAVKGYPTGTTALTDSTLYTYIKDLYDNSNITGTDTYAIDGSIVSVPYKLISTGSKVVLSTYSSAVQSVYNSQGYALYYVIDTTNETVTLPMGEIFGLIRAAYDKVSTTITYWE